MMSNSVCCIIVTYNIGERFYECYNAISNQVEEIVIVDNGSNEETISVLKELEKNENTVVIYNHENLGIATALNLGVKYAVSKDYKWVITLDNDSESTKDMVNTMLNVYDSLSEDEKEEVVSIFPTYLEKGYDDVSDVTSNTENKDFDLIESEITSGNILNTKIFNKVGYFDEKLFIDYVDHEFSLRLVENGYKSLQCKGAFLLHRLGNSKKKELFNKDVTYTNHSALRRAYMTRNRLYVWNKYKHMNNSFIKHDKSAFFKEIIKIVLLENKKYDKLEAIVKGFKYYKKGKFGKID